MAEVMIIPMFILGLAMLVIGLIAGYKMGYKDGIRKQQFDSRNLNKTITEE